MWHSHFPLGSGGLWSGPCVSGADPGCGRRPGWALWQPGDVQSQWQWARNGRHRQHPQHAQAKTQVSHTLFISHLIHMHKCSLSVSDSVFYLFPLSLYIYLSTCLYFFFHSFHKSVCKGLNCPLIWCLLSCAGRSLRACPSPAPRQSLAAWTADAAAAETI